MGRSAGGPGFCMTCVSEIIGALDSYRLDFHFLAFGSSASRLPASHTTVIVLATGIQDKPAYHYHGMYHSSMLLSDPITQWKRTSAIWKSWVHGFPCETSKSQER